MSNAVKNVRNIVDADTGKKANVSKLMRNPLYAEMIIYFIVFLLAVVTIVPILNVFAQSLSPAHVISRIPFMLWPHEFSIEAYRYIFNTPALVHSFYVSVCVTVVGTTLSLLVTVLAAYGLSKTHIPGNALLMKFFVVAMLFGAGIIPTYIVINKLLGLINTYPVLVLPYIASSYNIILMRNFFWSIPAELEESATIDGASDLQILWTIILPLSKPAIATIGLFYAVGHWNDFYRGLIYINDSSMWPLPMMLRSIVVDNQMVGMGSVPDEQQRMINPDNIKAATIIFATVPILCVYPFIQKYFTQGIMIGAIKG
ncbi:MAG: carbohydrate ABC transporter permease [Oscillospiraceae bacterium]|nr:carbohydrate ABC transporter permease [Oscillospiraceae bacterium]